MPFHTTFKYYMGMHFGERTKQRVRDFRPTVMHVSVPDLTGREAVRWALQEGIPRHGNVALQLRRLPAVLWA